MSELDLGLKCGVRALLWAMGYSTRLDVELRGNPTPGRHHAPETYTDLDVLGISINASSHASIVIADCKSGRRDKPTARMFWLRGVTDFFQADKAMLVREHDVNDATRQLAARLGINVLAPGDLLRTQELYPAAVSADSALGVLFDRQQVEVHLSAFTGLDRRLRNLLDYAQFDYWLYDRHQNLTQLVAHLRLARHLLDANNPVHQALLFDLAWQYILSLAYTIEHIRSAFITDPDRGLEEYLCGGPIALRGKKETAEALRGVAPEGAEFGYLPPYYQQLRELVARLMRRPEATQTMLRYAEAASALTLANQKTSLPDAFGVAFVPIPAKLVADVVGYMVAVGELDPQFRNQARAQLLAEPTPIISQDLQTRKISCTPQTQGSQATLDLRQPTPDNEES